jgi:P-type conjugative transfer protein TrbJ
MKNIRRLSMVFVIVAFLLVSPAAEAFLGFGDIVFDPSVFMQTLFSYFTQIEEYSTQAEQLSNQIQSLMNEAQNLTSMDNYAAGRAINGIRNSLTKLSDLRASVRGITMDYEKLESAWDSVYSKDFTSFNGKPVKDYVNAADKILKQTNNATYDAMRAQGLVAQINDDAANLESLLDASNSASGALAAAQAGNQIAGVTSQQLMRLQHIVAASYRAQSSFYAEQAQKQAMAKAHSDKFYGDKIKKSLQGQGNGKSTKQY